MDLTAFAADVGSDGAVTITGLGTRGGAVPGVRVVHSPAGIDWIQADEMIACCGAGTPVAELEAALLHVGQRVALPSGGTVGGALAVGRSDVRRLGLGPVRDVLLQARYVSAFGEVVKAGGPTVKNVSGFDLCRLLVGSYGTLGFLGEVVVRTRPIPACSQWFSAAADEPFTIFGTLYRPVSVLWDGSRVWALLEGHPDDVAAQSAGCGLRPVDLPPEIPIGGRSSVAPSAIGGLRGGFVAEVGIGVVHWQPGSVPAAAESSVTEPGGRSGTESSVTKLGERVKAEFDPTGRLNPGVRVGS